jgi:hypothetical protein
MKSHLGGCGGTVVHGSDMTPMLRQRTGASRPLAPVSMKFMNAFDALSSVSRDIF